MVLNSFFLQGSPGEQNLVQDLINEQLRMYGVEVHYMPRKYITEKTVIQEVIASKFDNAYPIEAYLNNYEGYGDQTTLLSKFGIQAINEVTLTISKDRFESYISPLSDGQDGIKIMTRPAEGDLIYFPLGDRLFEIKYVEHSQPFFQLKKNYIYTLKCELFRYENEVIDTGVGVIDDVLAGDSSSGSYGGGGGYIDSEGEGSGTKDIVAGTVASKTLTMVGLGTGAEAYTGYVADGAIRFITVTNRGGGYSLTPRVAISSAPSTGVNGIGTATMIGGVVACNLNVDPSNKSVQSVEILNPGMGYTGAPGVRFVAPPTGGAGAAGTATIGDGVVGIITITNGGSGYTVASKPLVTFTGSATVSAAATVVVSSAGTISQIRLTNSGLGYTTPPTITFANPPVTGSGSYSFNEIVTGQTSGVTARVVKWTESTRRLEVSNYTGNFDVGETIVGTASSASYELFSSAHTSADTGSGTVGGFGVNDEIEVAADSIIDFSEINPFGMP